MKPMDTIQDLIEEAKLRTVWWALCIFAVTYFFSHTSKSMVMNIPIAIFVVFVLRILFNEVEFCRKDRSLQPKTYLSLLEKKQISVNDSRLSTPPPPAKWKRNIGSPIVEAAANEFIDKILKEFVVDLWYSEITPDRDFPEHIRGIILDAIGEISGRVKELNLVDLLTRDIVDLIGDHIDVFRRIQASIGPDVMRTLSSEERDERLKYHLMVSKELHPALVSPESEYKVLQQLVGGLIALVLRPREAQVPVVRSIARELVTCLIVQPLLNFANPTDVNEVLELIFLALKDDYGEMLGFGGDQLHQLPGNHNHPALASSLDTDASSRKPSSSTDQESTKTSAKTVYQQAAPDWARGLEAATQRRTEVLMPENLENMWAKGRNYKKKEAKRAKGVQDPLLAGALPKGEGRKEIHIGGSGKPITSEEKNILRLNPSSVSDSPLSVECDSHMDDSSIHKRELPFQSNCEDDLEGTPGNGGNGRRNRLKRSSSTSALKVLPESKKPFAKQGGGHIISQFYSPIGNHSEEKKAKAASDIIYRTEAPHAPKLRCRVMGAYFEKVGSKSFAVYSIAVSDTESRTWFVKRRYSNFERLHRHLKEIPNYTLHLPPKRIFSSSTEDSFVHQRCIQLDKYLQDLLSIANVAEQHEVWDFLSASSKSYSFGKSGSVMRSLAVNVDDAVDDIVRQFKGVSNGLMRSIVGSTPSTSEPSDMVPGKSLSWHSADDIGGQVSRQSTAETLTSASDIEDSQRDGNHDHEEEEGPPGTSPNGWHSDNELNSKEFPPRVVKKRGEEFGDSNSNVKHNAAATKSERTDQDAAPALTASTTSEPWGGPNGMPPEWTPPNVCVPMLNLVDKVFQLKRRGWLRRQVFWMSKQILQLVMEDAIDDWLLRQIQWLRSEDTVTKGIRWVQDLLWPGGKFFINLRNAQSSTDETLLDEKLFGTGGFGGSKVSKEGSFESQLEAARRASDVKKMLFNGPPAALVSLVGPKQYRRCARDIYYFSQSTVCIKQLAYGILELLLISVFPELRDLVVDVRQKMVPQNPEKAAEKM